MLAAVAEANGIVKSSSVVGRATLHICITLEERLSLNSIEFNNIQLFSLYQEKTSAFGV